MKRQQLYKKNDKMFKTTLVLTLFLFSCFIFAQTRATKDYCWRDYDGTIPEDALLGGRDKDGKNIYIGQAYVQNEGLVVVQINSGQKTVYAEMEGIKLVDQNIKILCGPPENFYWIQTNFTKLHEDITKKNLVVGGHEDGAKRYFVGRIKCNDGLFIGKVLEMGWGGKSLFLGVDKNRRQLQNETYEVLVNEIVINERNAVASQ